MVIKFKLIGYENIQVSLFTFLFFSSFQGFKKRVCNEQIYIDTCMCFENLHGNLGEFSVFDKDFAYSLPQYTEAL